MAEMGAFNEEARQGLERGVNTLADVVKAALGPGGRNLVLGKHWDARTIANDGVPISQEIELEDPYENIGAELIKEVAKMTDSVTGDGTTTAIVLAQALVKEGLLNVATGTNPLILRRGVDKAVQAVTAELLASAKKIESKEEIAAIASIAAGDNEIGALVAEALDKVGEGGAITVEESNTADHELELTQGTYFLRGYISAYFITDVERQETVLEDPYILIVNSKITNVKELAPILEKVMQLNRSLLIIADDVTGDALSALVANKLRGTLNVAAVKAPHFGDHRKSVLTDIAIQTGGQVVSVESGLSLGDVGPEVLGAARKVVITKDSTIIVEGAGTEQDVANRVSQLKGELARTDSGFEAAKLQVRLTKLAPCIAVIRVGAATEVERKKLKHRIEIAVRNARAAVEEGIVAGGGVALVQAGAVAFGRLNLKGDEATGANIVRVAIEAPLKQIALNAGQDPDAVIDKVMSLPPGHGLDASTGKYVDLFAVGVNDPVKVTRAALQNAASITELFLATEPEGADLPFPASAGLNGPLIDDPPPKREGDDK